MIRPTVRETIEALKAYYSQRGIGFSYNIFRRIARAICSGQLTQQSITDACNKRCKPVGLPHNLEVSLAFWRQIKDVNLLCHDAPRTTVGITKDFVIRAPTDFFVTVDRRPRFVFLQPRRGYAPNPEQFGLLAAIYRATYLKDEYKDGDVWFFDFSAIPGTKKRSARQYFLTDLPVVDKEDANNKLTIFAESYRQLVGEGWQPPKRPAKEKPRAPAEEDRAPRMFTPEELPEMPPRGK